MDLGGLQGLRGFQVAMVRATQLQGNAAGAGAVPGHAGLGTLAGEIPGKFALRGNFLC